MYMQTAVVNVKINPRVKKEAQKVAEELGFSLSSLINGYLKHLVRVKSVNFSLEENPSDYMIKSLEESKKDVREGKVSPEFDEIEDAINWLKNPAKKYEAKI